MSTDKPSQHAELRIMVLDDEPFMLRLLGRILHNLGFKSVVTVDNGMAALAQLTVQHTRPELILLDINMPHMDGVEFVRHLVERQYTGSLILVSGEDERVLQSVEKLVRAHQIKVLGRVSKPVTPERLATLIGDWSGHGTGAALPTRRTYLPSELEAAISQGELVNHYQPKVSLLSGALVGVESLVRWLHPVHGMVFPDQFIALAEQSGLIDRLTRTVLQNALLQASVWHKSGLALRVAVNFSMENLKDLTFLDYVLNLTGQAGVAPHSIVLEITESSLMQDQRVPLEILTRLRLHHFGLSIDDFGTGNSSLSQLRDIPFDELKIDQSFVHGACSNATQCAMVDASLGLAKQLRMESVAEGVEDRADWDFVRGRGCDVAQGYFIGRPMPAEDFPAWQADWETRRIQLLP
jgi:EAL domain-containing protein (putative c-di-GMP-specific phosphodiesterase class I)